MSRRVRVLALLVAAATVVAVLPASAVAHGLSARRDLPVPEWLFAWAAAVVLAASFVGLAVLWQRPKLEQSRERVLGRVPRWLDPACGAVGVTLFALVVAAGFTGTENPTRNLAPTFVFVVFWVGLAIVCALLGDVFRAFNPWRAIARATGAVARRAGVARTPSPYPERLGRWPAAVGLMAFAWFELVMRDNDVPSTVATLALLYAAVQLAGIARYGVETWTSRGDAFAVYFDLFARIAPLTVRDRQLIARVPLRGLLDVKMIPGTLAVVLVIIGSTAFDGATNSDIWASASESLEGLFAGLGATWASQLARTIGLLASVGLITGVYRGGIAGMRSVGGARPGAPLQLRFAMSLVPIALAYLVAHYFSLVAFQGQAVGFLISDPFGTGANVFGTAAASIDYDAVSASTIWYVQVVALVGGHVAALAMAHDRALVEFADVRHATRSQYWMLTVMVGYTALGLWLLSSVAP